MQLHWHNEPVLLILVLGAGWLYALGVGPFRDRIAPKRAFPKARAAMFFAGLATAYLAVGSPLDALGEQFLFSAHMVQHMLLIYAAPMLLLEGTPDWLIDRAIDKGRLARPLRTITHPACGGVLFTFLYTVWHIPALYELGLRNKFVHILEHWMMFLPGLLMLWPFLALSRRVPRRGYGLQILALFLLMVGQLPVFAFLCFANEPLYQTYVWAPRVIDLDPLNDQILGGIIMKVTNMGVSLALLGNAFHRWAQSEEAAEADAPAPDAPASAVPRIER